MLKTFFLILFIGLPVYEASAQCIPDKDSICIYLMRHAEKADDGTSDPPLDLQGTERSLSLRDSLIDDGIDAIYSTPYNRTRETVIPLSKAISIDVYDYDFRDLDEEVNEWFEIHKGQSIIIVGHSNTTPFLVNMILDSDTLKQLEEDAYGDLFILKAYSRGNAKLSTGKFGQGRE